MSSITPVNHSLISITAFQLLSGVPLSDSALLVQLIKTFHSQMLDADVQKCRVSGEEIFNGSTGWKAVELHNWAYSKK